MDFWVVLFAGALVFCAFTLSTAAGLGGSLVLVGGLVLILGAKKGIAVAALLLAVNNVAKLYVYRETVPVMKSLGIVLATALGSALGALLLDLASETALQTAVIAAMLASFALESRRLPVVRLAVAPVFAFVAGLCSGFSGTSGPLKGLAVRSLQLQRQYFVGCCALVSMAGDLAKTAVFASNNLFDSATLVVLALTLPMLPITSILGRSINQRVGENGFAALFWAVMGGYAIRLLCA